METESFGFLTPKFSDFNKVTTRDCPSNLMNAIGLSKEGDRVPLHSMGAISAILVTDKKVSLIIFSGQSLDLLFEKSFNLGYKFFFAMERLGIVSCKFVQA